MVKHFFLKEIHEQIISSKMLVYLISVIILFVLGAFIFTNSYTEELKKADLINNSTQEHIRKGANNLSELIFTKQTHIKSPSAQAFISSGSGERLPNGFDLDYFSESQPLYFRAVNNYFSSFNTVDFAFLIFYLASFFCVSFTFNAFSGEKTDGTLKLILSNSVSRTSIVIGKFLGILTIVLIPIILGLLICLGIFQLSASLTLPGSGYVVILLFLLSTIIFISFLITLGLFISAITHHPSISLSLLLGIWIVFAIILPNTTWVIAKESKQAATLKETERQEKQMIEDLYATGKYSLQINSSWRGKAPNKTLISRATGRQESVKLRNKVWRNYQISLLDQTNIALNVSKISPFSVFDIICQSLGENGFYAYRNYYSDLVRYQKAFFNFVNQKDREDEDSYHLIWNERWYVPYFMSKKGVDFDAIPSFTITKISVSQKLNMIKGNLLILLCWLLIMLLLTFKFFNKYDVR